MSVLVKKLCTLSAPQNVDEFCFLSDASNSHWEYKNEPNGTYLSPKESFPVHNSVLNHCG